MALRKFFMFHMSSVFTLPFLFCVLCFHTGKTSTVVESILRICRANPYKRILACAPSDAAADVLCDRLSRTLSPKQLFRLCWYQRVTASLPAKLRAYSSLVNDIFEVPNLKQLQTYQVIVCNCGTAGVLKTLQPSGANGSAQVLPLNFIFGADVIVGAN